MKSIGLAFVNLCFSCAISLLCLCLSSAGGPEGLSAEGRRGAFSLLTMQRYRRRKGQLSVVDGSERILLFFACFCRLLWRKPLLFPCFFCIFVGSKSLNSDAMKDFRIRSYGRTELAMLYCPDLTGLAAYRKMHRWMERCPGLMERLNDLGYEAQRRSFTPLELRVIVDALGEP